jgi:hypothetical protein
MSLEPFDPFVKAVVLLLAGLIYKKWVADKPPAPPPSQRTIINNIYLTPPVETHDSERSRSKKIGVNAGKRKRLRPPN